MTPVRSVTSLLATQPVEDLQAMQESIRAEIARLEVELSMVTEALGRRKRRQPSRQREIPTPGRAHGGQFTGLRRDDLYAAIFEFGRPVKPLEVYESLIARGVVTSPDSVRTGMSRLWKAGRVIRVSDGVYAIPNVNGQGDTTEASEGTALLSRGTDQTQGQNPDTG